MAETFWQITLLLNSPYATSCPRSPALLSAAAEYTQVSAVVDKDTEKCIMSLICQQLCHMSISTLFFVVVSRLAESAEVLIVSGGAKWTNLGHPTQTASWDTMPSAFV